MVRAFLSQPNKPYRNFQIAFAILTIQFFVPSLGYLFRPADALSSIATLGGVLGWPPLPTEEGNSGLWRMLSFSNVFALAFACFWLMGDLPARRGALVPLLVLKGGSAFGSLWLALFQVPHPFFWFVVGLDGITCGIMWFFATRALVSLPGASPATLIPRPPSLA